jgi:hypothetical protein
VEPIPTSKKGKFNKQVSSPIYYGIVRIVNNFIKILDLLKKKGGFSFLSLRASRKGGSQSQKRLLPIDCNDKMVVPFRSSQ